MSSSSKAMRVAMYYNNRDVRLEEMPVPKIGPGELLLRVEASGICGSDVLEWYRLDKAPLVLGHEVAGTIAQVGEGIAAYKKGQRIAAAHHVPCNACYYCLNGHSTVCETLRRTNFDPGGFAEFVRLPAINVDRGVYLLPDEVSFEEATFIEPVACALRGQNQSRLRTGHSVLVMGTGVAGLLHIAVARALGAGPIFASDIVDFRLRAASRFGASAVFQATAFSPASLRQENDGRLADLVIVCTTAKAAIEQAFTLVERGGTILFFAPTAQGETVPLSINDLFWRNEVTLTSSYAGSPAEHATALELIRSKHINVADMITHRLGLEETELGFQLVVEGGESLKVIIEPQR